MTYFYIHSGTSDFFGLNFYSGGLVSPEAQSLFPPSYATDKDVREEGDDSWVGYVAVCHFVIYFSGPFWSDIVSYIYYDAHIYCRSGSSWLKVTPWFLRSILVWIKKEYNNVPVLITENGISDRNGSLSDEHRIHYFRTYINYMLQGNWMIPTKRRKIKMATVYFFYF